MDPARAMAERIKENAPLAVQAAKELAVRSQDMSLADGLRMEQLENRILHQCEDTRTARIAFTGKRNPEFRGR